MSVNDKLLADLLTDYPAFEAVVEAFPEACEAVANADLPPELAAERDALLVVTAALWERWNALGRAIAMAGRPTLIQ